MGTLRASFYPSTRPIIFCLDRKGNSETCPDDRRGRGGHANPCGPQGWCPAARCPARTSRSSNGGSLACSTAGYVAAMRHASASTAGAAGPGEAADTRRWGHPGATQLGWVWNSVPLYSFVFPTFFWPFVYLPPSGHKKKTSRLDRKKNAGASCGLLHVPLTGQTKITGNKNDWEKNDGKISIWGILCQNAKKKICNLHSAAS